MSCYFDVALLGCFKSSPLGREVLQVIDPGFDCLAAGLRESRHWASLFVQS